MSSDLPMQSPEVSVVIAVYNGANTLSKTLASLKNQTFSNFEIVLVNDESRDNSEEIIQTFKASNPKIMVQAISQKNRGLGGARNTGMRQACGKIIALLDQDDIWYATKLGKMVAAFQKHPRVDFVTHHLNRRVAGELKEELRCDFMVQDVFQKLLFKGNYFCGSAMSFRKTMLEKIGYFSEGNKNFDLSEDYDYWLRASAKGFQFFVIPECLGEYIVHQNNFSKNKLMMFRNEWNIVKEHFANRPMKHWSDTFCLCKRRAKILAREMLARVGS